MVYFGEQSRRRIISCIQHSGGIVYDVPTRLDEIHDLAADLRKQIQDTTLLLLKTSDDITTLLQQVAYDPQSNTSPFVNWLHRIRCEMAISNTLRKAATVADSNTTLLTSSTSFSSSSSSASLSSSSSGVESRMLMLEGWIPRDSVNDLSESLYKAVESTQQRQAVLQKLEQQSARSPPPTYLKQSSFTQSFQSIVDTYGVPRYKEVNPGLFTIISFPFLFGVMYGDVGHGFCLLLVALYLVLRQNRFHRLLDMGQLDEISSMIFQGRFLLLLMASFAIYAGFIYNDCLSLSLPLFDSSYSLTTTSSRAPATTSASSTYRYSGTPYPFGIDSVWGHASNDLSFHNSFKMKLSVTIGVVQMTFGLFLALANDMYFDHPSSIYFEFVPRLVFMLSTFGYMVFLIVYKFCVDWSLPNRSPPNLIQTMIQMFLQPGTVDADKELFPGQATVQLLLLLLSMLSIPVMLFGPPLYERYVFLTTFKLKRRGGDYVAVKKVDTDDDLEGDHDSEGEDNDEGSVRGGSERSTSRIADSKSKSRTSLVSTSSGTTSGDDSQPDHEHHYDDDDVEMGRGSSDEHPPRASSLSKSDSSSPKKPSSSWSRGQSSHPVGETQSHSSGLSSSYSFSDHLITNGIHTIEFVLGCVSNTASYLRLWALSLAHAELSRVFWTRMVMQYGIETGSVLLVVCGVTVWAAATFSVLLCMDVLECFLHALRLHWVEFQNKFYHADGYAFDPYKFNTNAKREALQISS